MKKKILFTCFLLLSAIASNSLFSQGFTVYYKCAQPEPEINKIKPQIKVANSSGSSVNLSDIKVRYWFSAEGYVQSILSVDYAYVGGGNITGTFAKEYLEIGFSSGAVADGSDSGEVQLRIEKSSHGYFIQSDDYSFDPSFTDWGASSKLTCYYKGSLVWGAEPPAPPAPTAPPSSNNDWLHANGSALCDANGNSVRITGINWFGFETNPLGLGGLQALNWKKGCQLIATRGFNTIRIPISLELIMGWSKGTDPQVQFVSGVINPDIDGVTSLVLLDSLIDYCKIVGLKIIIDLHCLPNNVRTALWYGSGYTINDVQTGLKWIASRYKSDDTLIGCDLFNEPHGQGWVDGTAGAKWDGSTDANNWRKAAGDIGSAVLASNPNLLILVEGVESYPVEGATYASTDKYQYICNWWGGNLRGVKDYPVSLGSNQNKLIYSPHDYGPLIYVQPWFSHTFTQATLYDECWQPNWFYIVEANTAPILIGEWGGKLDGGDNQKWLNYLSSFIDQKGLNHTFWALNPDSSDTGGLVQTDWVTVDEAKYNIIKPSLWKSSGGKYIGLDHEVLLGLDGTGTNVSVYYGGSVPTSQPTQAPTIQPSPDPTVMLTQEPTSLPTQAPTPDSSPAPTGSSVLGDVNGDGSIDIVDALLVAQYYVGLTPVAFITANADVTKDGAIDIVDALRSAQYYVGLITGF
jgi:aryl-phospho-beta-D-glucosidase BglC (GH1 family)